MLNSNPNPEPPTPQPWIRKENMAEDTRLKDRLNVLNSTPQTFQPQHPPQTVHTENLLKETEDYNNIDYTVFINDYTMAHSQQIVLDYLVSSEKGEILKRNGQELKKLKIGEKTYNFERGKTHLKNIEYQIQQD